MMLYIDPANDAPGVQNGPTPGDISSHILGKAYTNLLLRNHEFRSFYTLCVVMFNNPSFKSCHLCSWGAYRPHPRAGSLRVIISPTSKAAQISRVFTGPLVLWFSHFWEIFGTHEIGGKKPIFSLNWEINCVISSQIGKVYLLNSNFSAIWESFRLIGNFFSQLGKSLVPQIRPSFVKRIKALQACMIPRHANLI